MAFTTPATAVAGTILTAAWLNTYVRDNVAWLATDSPSCRAYNAPGQSLPAAVGTSLTFNSERYDNAAMHSTSSNTARITVPTGGGGKYLVGGYTLVPGQATPGNYHGHAIQLNATTQIAAIQVQVLNSAVYVPGLTNSAIWSMSASDYFNNAIFHSCGRCIG